MPALVIFDLDGTLARSKQPIEPSMAVLLSKLLAHTNVAVISGGAFAQFEKQVVARLPAGAPLKNLYILPTSGAALYEWSDGVWKKIYEERISENDVPHLKEIIRTASTETGLIDFSAPSYGERIEYRGGQITVSALGQLAPIEKKEAWDPTKAKRHKLRDAIAAQLPRGFSAAIGGRNSVDITKEGIDKAYGIRQLSKRLHIPETRMLYVGDELEKGGNDEAAYKTEVKTHAVTHPQETENVISKLLA